MPLHPPRFTGLFQWLRAATPLSAAVALALSGGCDTAVNAPGTVPAAPSGDGGADAASPEAPAHMDGGTAPSPVGPDGGATTDATAAPDTGTPGTDPGWTNDTEAQLDAFWQAHDGPEGFPASYVDAVQTLLRTEDDVERGDFAAARARLDEVFSTYPLSDPVWWSGVEQDGTNVGTPVAYYGLRMLDEIVSRALAGATQVTSQPIQLTVVMPRCAQGLRPTNVELTEHETVELQLHPDLLANDHRIIRQSLRLFQHYVWAITGGALQLGLHFEQVDECVSVNYRANPSYAGIDSANDAIEQVPEQVQGATDMWWVLYPSNVPAAPIFDDTAFITGGMGGRGRAPVFIIDDLWLVRIPPHLGRGPYSEVERRVYLPQWLQHEFYHHLFRTWPEFLLEEEGHQWFDRSTWPEDFVGAWEPDYYAESLRKRLDGATPSVSQALRIGSSDFDASALTTQDLVGSYERRPVENDWHRVTIALEGNTLTWRNAAGAAWELTWADGVLRSVPDSPYGAQTIDIEPERTPAGEPLPTVRALYFNGERHVRL